jgi:GT2 family glycosyltransferase
MTELSIVLISRNQDWNTARLVESCLNRVPANVLTEIVWVDSASTDKTADIACRYPINVLRLRPDQPLSPAAGRFVGFQATAGDFVLFLDGDMELYVGWVEQALALMARMPDVAAVTGRVLDYLPGIIPQPGDQRAGSFDDTLTEVRHGGGAALYRRAVLEQVGTFNPFLLSDEEPELCLRIRHAGYRVVRTNHPISYHYSAPRTAISTLMARWRRHLYMGYGQTMRYHLGSPLLWAYIKERGFALLTGCGVLLGLGSLVASLITGQWGWFAAWIVLIAGALALDAWRKRSLYRPIFSLLHRLLILDGTIRGFWLPALPSSEYPTRVDVLKRTAEVQEAYHE